MAQQDYTPHQQKIIKRYYDNQDTVMRQRLAELVSELYLSQGKKRQKAWTSAAREAQRGRSRARRLSSRPISPTVSPSITTRARVTR